MAGDALGNPAVDGDGITFLVAYEEEPTLNSGDKDVHARVVFRMASR